MHTEGGDRRGGTRAALPLTVVVVALVAATFTVVVAQSQPAAAATVTVGTIQAQMADHVGVDNGTNGNCIRYDPTGTSTSSALVSSPSEALTAHGYRNNCPNNLSTSNQSAIGFRPSAVTSVTDGQQFLIGRMVHYNNPINANDRYFTGRLNTVLSGFTSPNTLTFNWSLDETPNSGGGNCCNDEIAFTNQISNVNLTQGGLQFRLVMLGFVPVASGTTCPAVAAGSPQNVFSTVEGEQTHACLYATVAQTRTLTIVKQVAGSAPARSFGFTSSSALAGSPWSNGTFNLSAGGTLTQDLTSGNTVTVTETDPADDRWSLTNLTCTQIGANGQPQAVPGATINPAARQVVLNNVPAPPLAAQPGITCTYTNTYTPKATLSLLKSVQSGTAAPSLWTLTATGSVASPPAGTQISGPSGSAAVTLQRVPAGTYTLTETGTGAAETGYVQVGDWACQTAGGATVPVTAGTVTLPDNAASTTSANVTCTVTNRLATGSLRITKVVDAPAGAYTGGTTKTFSGTYDCGTGSSGAFSTLTTAVPVTITGIPAGRSCTVTETPPIGGLANASYAWDTPTSSTQPVTITDQGTATVTITNHVVQRFGNFALTKSVSGPGGYVGGTQRVFPVAYSCTLANGPTTAGTVNASLAGAVSPAASIPAGSVCSFTETLATQAGDFADPSYTWTGYTVNPTTVTIQDGTTATVAITNTYARELGSLVIAKVVQGDGYLGGTAANFTVFYDCAPGFAGVVTVAAGASVTIPGLPARVACTVQEVPPDPALLAPAYTWGTPTWSPGPVANIVANASTTLTVTNPTVPVFGQLRVTKAITGETAGVTAGATFIVTADCGAAGVYPFELGVNQTGSTPDLPVGTSCTVTEAAPTGGLVDSSYAWGPTPGPQDVTVRESGQVVAVTVTNTVVRVRGQLTITKASITPTGIVDPARTFTIDYSCQYGNDPAVAGSVTLTAGQSASTPPVLLGSNCLVNEDSSNLTAPPSADPSWVWLPVSYDPFQQVVVTSATTPVSVTVINSIQQLTGAFNVSKVVTGAGKEGGYTPGATFAFSYSCTTGASGTFDLADGDSFPFGPLPTATQCTITETGKPPTSPAYGWDPVEFTVNGVTSGSGSSVTFTISEGVPIQVNALNPITPRLGSVTIAKQVTGETAGLAPGAPPFTVTLTCGPARTYQLDVPANGSATQNDVPVGSVCTATESAPTGGLVDASYAWGSPSYEPPDATVTVAEGPPGLITITNPIERVLAPVQLVKSFTGAQGIIDPARTYPITWSCTYAGTPVAGGTVNVAADPAGVTLADAVPVTSVCSATEGDLGVPSADPAFRWLPPVITPTTVAIPGPNTITVANELTRDNGTVFVRKEVIGAVDGYIGTGEDFTLHGQCLVPGHPEIPTRYRDGTIANGGEVPIEPVSIGWTCSGREDTPSQDLLRDASYAWGPAILDPPGTFVLTRDAPTRVFLAQNPIVRVSSSFTIEKDVVDPNGVVDDTATFTGTYSCQYGSDPPVEGTWTITPATDPTFTVDDLLLTSVCTVTENDPGTTGLPDGSWTWAPVEVGEPAPVVAGGTASVTVVNTVERLWGGLQVTKTVVDPDGGMLPGAQFGGLWECTQGEDTYSDRFTVGADATTTLVAPEDERVPATAVCTITEDTLEDAGLRDGSFTWDEPTYVPEDGGATLVAGETASVGVTNTVIRVYSDVTINKVVTGPAVVPVDLVPHDREFTGTVTCQYPGDDPITTTWLATRDTPALRAGVLVESECSVTEDPAGAGGQPVTGDPSYVWEAPQISDPVTVTPPDVPTPPIVVTNPTKRLFGTFTVTKSVSGATEGIADPSQLFHMEYECTPGTGPVITGTLDVPAGQVRDVGPDAQIPTGSTCTLTEPPGSMPDLRDDAWTWADPTFTVDRVAPVPPDQASGRTLTFQIPVPQEDEPEPNVAIGVDNPVVRTFGAYTVAKTSDPPSGSVVPPGSLVTYTVTLTSTGTVPVHDVVVTDDLTGVLAFASVEGVITPPTGTAVVDPSTQRLVWTVGDLAPGQTLTLTYQVRIALGAGGVTIANSVTATGDTPPSTCAATAPTAGAAAPALDLVGAADPLCSTTHQTSTAPVVTKTVSRAPTRDAATGEWTIVYGVAVTNPNPTTPAPYSLTDTLGFPEGFEVRSATVTSSPPGVTLATPPWDGTANTAVATDAQIAPASAHNFELTVRVAIPPATPAAALSCSAGPGAGLFNAARLTSLGTESDASACDPVALVVEVTKQWKIDGTTYPNGRQPDGFAAQLTLDEADRGWGTDYPDYQPGVSVAVAEDVQVPATCTNRASGVGTVRLDTAFTALTVTNTVTCAELPRTGLAADGLLRAAAVLVASGAALLLLGRRRRPVTSPAAGAGSGSRTGSR